MHQVMFLSVGSFGFKKEKKEALIWFNCIDLKNMYLMIDTANINTIDDDRFFFL